MTPGYEDIEVDERTIQIGLACGLMRWDADAEVYVLTPAGREWLATYCDQKIAEVKAARKIPRPPGWDGRVLRKFRRAWHRAGLPCLFCRLEGRGWRP